MMNTSKSSVNRVIQHQKQTGSVKARQQPGRRSKFTLTAKRKLVRLSALCPRLIASQLKLKCSLGHSYTLSDVKRNMRSQRLFGRIAEREKQVT